MLLNPYRFLSSGGGGTDPDFSKVSLLLHMDGANGSTVFPDKSSNPKVLTPNGSVQISTARSKFGGASALFNGGYLSGSSSPAFYPTLADDFTVECWIYITAYGSAVMRIAGFANAAGGNETWSFNVETDGRLGFTFYDTTWRTSGSAPGAVPLNQWVHVAGVKSGTSVMVFVNGVKGATVATIVSNPVTPTSNFGIGRFGNYNGQYFIGSIDDFRITKGAARYTANFTPPTEAFPDS